MNQSTHEERPRGLLTPFNVAATLILAVGAVITFMRFTQGLEATTNLNQDFGWGLWIGFDVMSGVALAAGGFTMSAAVYLCLLISLFTRNEYESGLRNAECGMQHQPCRG